MPDAEAFHEFIRRIRAGDEDAAAQLVRNYEPLIRRENVACKRCIGGGTPLVRDRKGGGANLMGSSPS